MFIVFFYAVLGGMKGITYTQIAQYVVLITAYTIPAIFISLQLTGNPLPQLGLGSTLTGSDMYLLDKLDLILVDLDRPKSDRAYLVDTYRYPLESIPTPTVATDFPLTEDWWK